MTFNEWYELGIDSGFITRIWCWTHDLAMEIPDDDAFEFDQGFDPCISVVTILPAEGKQCDSGSL